MELNGIEVQWMLAMHYALCTIFDFEKSNKRELIQLMCLTSRDRYLGEKDSRLIDVPQHGKPVRYLRTYILALAMCSFEYCRVQFGMTQQGV
jgi:hypothetical protein